MTAMSAIYNRRSERISLKRNVQLVFRNRHGRVDCIPAATFAVSCHGAGLYAHHDYALGSEVFLMDSQSGIGAWGKLVWEGEQLRDGRIPVGVEFTHPGNHWKTKLVPMSWMPYLKSASSGRDSVQPYMHPSSDKVVLVGKAQVEPHAERRSGSRPSGQTVESCRCCGGTLEVSRKAVQEPLCNVCPEWTR